MAPGGGAGRAALVGVSAAAATGLAAGVAVVPWRDALDRSLAVGLWPVALGGVAAAWAAAWAVTRRAPAAARRAAWQLVAAGIPCGAAALGLLAGVALSLGKGHSMGEVVASGAWTMVLAAVASAPTAAVAALGWWLVTRRRR